MSIKKLNISKNSPKTNFEEELLQNVSKFITKHVRLILIIIAFIILGSLYFVVVQPLNDKNNIRAHREMFKAIYHFEEQEYDKALNGYKNDLGFNQIIKKYPNTKAKKLAHLYVGIILMKNGKYQEARDNFKNFTIQDLILKSRSLALIGDSFSQQGRYKEAAQFYLKAAKYKPNSVFSPKLLIKAAVAFEKLNADKSAIKCYKEIIEKYKNTKEFSEAIKKAYMLNPNNDFLH